MIIKSQIEGTYMIGTKTVVIDNITELSDIVKQQSIVNSVMIKQEEAVANAYEMFINAKNKFALLKEIKFSLEMKRNKIEIPIDVYAITGVKHTIKEHQLASYLENGYIQGSVYIFNYVNNSIKLNRIVAIDVFYKTYQQIPIGMMSLGNKYCVVALNSDNLKELVELARVVA